MKHHSYYVYIVTNTSKTVLYVGLTNNLEHRLFEHYLNRGSAKSFAGKYYCYNLIYFEQYQFIDKAIQREKELKGWVRLKKDALIKTENPTLRFYNSEVCGAWPPPDDVQPRER